MAKEARWGKLHWLRELRDEEVPNPVIEIAPLPETGGRRTPAGSIPCGKRWLGKDLAPGRAPAAFLAPPSDKVAELNGQSHAPLGHDRRSDLAYLTP